MEIIKKFFKFLFTSLNYFYYKHKVKNIDYFNYKKLIYPNHKAPYGFASVINYGNWKAVAKLKGSRFNFLREYIEHGLSFFKTIESAEYLGYVNRKGIKKIYTLGEFRRGVLEEYLSVKKFHDREIVTVGPYIKGADNFYDKKTRDKLKEKYGKIMLVFPAHSFFEVKTKYEVGTLVNFIEENKNKFDSIFICMYWKDILDKPAEIDYYEKQGYIMVSNGHRHDPQFMSRQKDLIELADLVVTNEVSNCIGYAISMDTPVYYFEQKIEITLQDIDSLDDSKEKAREKCKELFGTMSFEITPEQKDYVRYYWGEWK
ncbi:MAG: hypothetical protein K6A41_01405 [Bacteroidales bacterium]|nr:hypothetical protein [Bacteroidales bacterium]